MVTAIFKKETALWRFVQFLTSMSTWDNTLTTITLRLECCAH